MPTVLMTVDAVGGVWSYALGLCEALPEFRFVLASLGPRPSEAQRAAVSRLQNTVLVEGDFRLEWMEGGQADIAASNRWLSGLASQHGADLVHVNGFAQAALSVPVPVIAVAHSDVLSWWAAVHGHAAPAEWSHYRRAVIAGLRTATRVVALTKAVRDDLRRHYATSPATVDVIANGIDLGLFTCGPKRPRIMAAGRVWDEAKNLRLLDGIAPALAWPIEIAGDCAHPESGSVALRHARALGLLSPLAMRSSLAEAAIYAAPARYEPFGLGILEAAASGCALVLGDIPSLRENWSGAAVFVPPNDAAEWRMALSGLIRNEAERRRLSEAARGRAERFAMVQMAASYRGLYRQYLPDLAERKVA